MYIEKDEKIKKILSEEEKNRQIEKFVKIYTKTFKNIYDEKELTKILNNNIKKILVVEQTERVIVGTYDGKTKEIKTVDETNEKIMYHEMLHAIRRDNDEITLPYPELKERVNEYLVSIIESFNEYATECIILNKNFNEKYEYGKPSRTSNRFKYINQGKKPLQNYSTLVDIAQIFEVLYTYINNNESLLTKYLKGENIFKEINKISIEYLNKKDKENILDNESLEISAMQFTYNFLTKTKEITDIISEKETKYILMPLEDEIKLHLEDIEEYLLDMYYTLSEGKIKNGERDTLNYFFKTTKLKKITKEEMDLISAILGEDYYKQTLEKKSIKSIINDLNESFNIRDNKKRVR